MPTVAQRYHLLKNRVAKDWWEATFADPISWAVLALVADYRWITPNGLTILSFLCRLVPAYFIAFLDRPYVIAAALLLQASQVLDSMDGNLARYRGVSTAFGGYLDRTLDLVGVLFVCCALSWHVHRQGADAYYLLMGPTVGALYLLICYIYWTIAHTEYKLIGSVESVALGKNVQSFADKPTWKYILEAQPRIIRVNHIDWYFWIGLALWLQRVKWVLWLLFVTTAIKAVYRFFTRPRRLRAHDRAQQAADPGPRP